MDQPVLAPPWRISEGLNTPPLDLAAQRGPVVVARALQMLCPGCVRHAIPQLKAVHALFALFGGVVVGLQTVFGNHEAMTTATLQAFLPCMSIESAAPWASMRPLRTMDRFRRPWQRIGCRVGQPFS